MDKKLSYNQVIQLMSSTEMAKLKGRVFSPSVLNIQFGKLVYRLSKELQLFNEAKEKIIAKYAVMDSGRPVADKNGKVTFSSLEDQQQCLQEISDLGMVEETYLIPDFDVDKLPADITPGEVSLILSLKE